MHRKKTKDLHNNLIETITDAMLDKKAKDPIILNFTGIPGSICDAFVICHGTSRTQVEAISDHIIGQVKKYSGIHPWHQEGAENAEWILIDYSDVVVHVFQEERRKFYNLEDLWGDAALTRPKYGS